MLWKLPLAIALALLSTVGPQPFDPAPGPSAAAAQPPSLDNRIVSSSLHPTAAIDVDAVEHYVALHDVVFPSPKLASASNPGGQLLTRSAPARNASECNQRCLQAGNVSWALPGGSATTATCALWRFCDHPGGCGSDSLQQYNALAAGACELQSFPSLVQGASKGPFVELGENATTVSGSLYGAPLHFSYSAVPFLNNYARYPGLDFVRIYDVGCPNITDPNLRIHPPDASVGDADAYCWITGTLQNISAACDSIPWCDLFVYFPLGKSLDGSSNSATSAFLKSTRGSHQPSMQSDLLDVVSFDVNQTYRAFNPLAVTYFKYERLLEGSRLKPSALTLSQLIAVLEVRNVTGAPEAAGRKLCEALRASMDLAPASVALYEAAASQSPLISSSDGSSTGPPASGGASQAALAAAAVPNATQGVQLNRVDESGKPLKSSLVVVCLTFSSPSDTIEGLKALFGFPTPQLLERLNKRLSPSTVHLLYVTPRHQVDDLGPPAPPRSGIRLAVSTIAGVAVGAALAGAAAVAVAWALLLQHRRRQQPSAATLFPPSQEGKDGAASASAESTVPNSVTMLIKKAAPGAGWTFSDSSGSGPDSNRSNGRRPGSGGRAAPGLAKTLDSRAPLSNVNPDDVRLDTNEDGTLRVLGTGTYGKVFLGRWRWHGRVAVKQLLEADERRERAFVQEAELLHALSHPNIVSFLGACLEPGRMLCVSEYLPNGSLEDLIRKDNERKHGKPRQLGWFRHGRSIATDVASGLAFLHGHRILHMDVKSSNVLLTRTLTAKISDVGIAKAMSPSGGVELTQARGSWAYMAPEVCDYRRPPVCCAADIFSYGVVLWEIITGERPDKLKGLRRPKVPAECPTEVLDLHFRCLSMNPAERPTAAQVVELITRLPKLSSKG